MHIIFNVCTFREELQDKACVLSSRRHISTCEVLEKLGEPYKRDFYRSHSELKP